MIDWVTAVLPCEHIPVECERILKLLCDGSIDWESPCRTNVTGSWDAGISIKSVGGDGTGLATHLEISGNPAKYLQGHNIFGTDELLDLVHETYLRIMKRLGLNPTVADINQVVRGEYQVRRLDVNYSFELPSRADVVAWLRAAEYRSRTRHGRPTMKGGTLYFGKTSRRWSIKAYCKAEEIEAPKHRLPDQLTLTPLRTWVQNKLRIELVIRGKELRERGIETARDAAIYGMRRLFSEYAEKIEMSEQIRLSSKNQEELPARLKLVYLAWEQGEDLRALCSPRTFYRHRKELLSFGIDITHQRPKKKDLDNVVPLLRVIEAKPAPIPQWAYDLGLIYSGKRRA